MIIRKILSIRKYYNNVIVSFMHIVSYYTLNNAIVHCTLYTVQCTLYAVHCTLYIVRCTLYSVHCTLDIVLCTVYIVFYIIYTMHNLLVYSFNSF